MQRALVGVAAVGILCAVLGAFVILKNLAFIGEGLAHSTLGGLAIAALIGVDFYLAAPLFTILIALLIGYVSETSGVTVDVSIGILFSTATALGILLIGLARFYVGDIIGFLFGNVLAISPFDLSILVAVAAAIVAVILLLYKEFVFASFDEEMARVCGLPTRLLNYLLLVMIAIAVVVSVQTIGIILITALLVIPASAASQLSNRLPAILFLSSVIAVISGVVGLYLSFYLNIASGASIVFTSALIFALAAALSPRRSFRFLKSALPGRKERAEDASTP